MKNTNNKCPISVTVDFQPLTDNPMTNTDTIIQLGHFLKNCKTLVASKVPLKTL